MDWYWWIAIIVLALVGVFVAFSTVFAAPDTIDDSYILGVDDILKIDVYGEADLTGSYRVAKDGTIAVPLIGEVMLKGRSIKQAQERIGA